jgi:hypothetical protein
MRQYFLVAIATGFILLLVMLLWLLSHTMHTPAGGL